MLVLSAKGLSRDYFVAKTLRNFPNGGNLDVQMTGDPGCSIKYGLQRLLKDYAQLMKNTILQINKTVGILINMISLQIIPFLIKPGTIADGLVVMVIFNY